MITIKITWLGQAGLLFEKDDFKIMIDPYLSNSVVKVNPKNFRRVPVDESFFEIEPNVMIFTHNHIDHYDPETAPRFITNKTNIAVLSPKSVFNEVRMLGGNNNYVLFNKGTTWTENEIKFTAVKAEHSDEFAIGVLIDDGERRYYITGDTLYNEDVVLNAPKDIDVIFLPINGVGNNMNMVDAKLFAQKCNAKKVVPLHFGLFDELKPEGFEIVPEFYKEIII